MTFVLESRQEGMIRLFSQPNCKGHLGGTSGTSEQILSYAPRVIHRLLYKSCTIKTAERLQNVKDAAEGQNDYKMSGLLSNATFIDKAVYHFGCIIKYLLTRTPGTS